jgi:hypothetical protein
MSGSERRDDEPERLDAPNQQVVREDESGPADEGNGGATEAPPAAPDPESTPDPMPEPDDE